MFYFIPAWYSANRKWHYSTAPWYEKISQMEFDDSIHQMKLFQQSGESGSLLILNYFPQLRYFLYRQELLDSEYWSVFDSLQTIRSETMMPFDFLDLDWPKGTNFIYTSFLVIARQGEEVIAHIEFAEEGNVYLIRWFQEGICQKDYLFDDRGFVSSILYYENGEKVYQDYLNTQGIWQFREWFQGQGVDINFYADRLFSKTHYDSLEELIQEELSRFFKKVSKGDKVVLAASEQHHVLVKSVLPPVPLVVSLFEERNHTLSDSFLAQIVNDARLIVSDSERQVKELREQGISTIYHISPYDTRLRLGKSQQVKELILYLQVDQLEPTYFQEILLLLAGEMKKNPLISLVLGTYREMSFLEEEINALLEATGFQEFSLKQAVVQGENALQKEPEPNRIFIEKISSELDLIRILETVRLLIDLGEKPDLYLQIAAISSGIPQIHRVKSSYIKDGQNGLLVEDVKELIPAIRYYLDGLKNWNDALVYSVRLIEEYKTGKLVAKWKEYLKEGEKDGKD